jgi:hypothetical protein
VLFAVISRAPGLKLVVQTLLSSLRPIGHIVVICCTFFIIFGILGVQVNEILHHTTMYQGIYSSSFFLNSFSKENFTIVKVHMFVI